MIFSASICQILRYFFATDWQNSLFVSAIIWQNSQYFYSIAYQNAQFFFATDNWKLLFYSVSICWKSLLVLVIFYEIHDIIPRSFANIVALSPQRIDEFILRNSAKEFKKNHRCPSKRKNIHKRITRMLKNLREGDTVEYFFIWDFNNLCAFPPRKNSPVQDMAALLMRKKFVPFQIF